VEEATGGGETGAAPLGGGSDDTDWACAAATNPTNKPRLTALDFNKLDIAETPSF
jgi:hypothetical protein